MNTLDRPGAFFPNIQCARACAALAVVAYHMNVLPSGQAGVDVFFVISGFIMSQVAPREGRAFLRKRLVRIVPLYWLTTLGVYAIAAWQPLWLNSTTARFDYLVKSLLFIPYVKENGHWGPLNLNGWTLEYEMLFYVVVTLALLLVRGRHATAFAALLLALFCTYVAVHGTRSALADHLGQPFVLEFGLGVLAHRVLASGIASRVAPRTWIGLVAASVAAIALLPFVGGTPAGFARVAGWGVPACVLIVALVALDLNGRSITNTLAAALGAASYSIYLLHPYVIGIATRIAGVRADLGTPLGIVTTSAILTVVCVAGYACHVMIEKPMLAMFDGRRKRPRRAPTAT
ncbi:acyltransferase [Burkholderia sp. Bp9143]|uniref:acyltransferase family protein n=1 Tax=Burkholderia sp. Bp9143 TaxID=2184574 RepID=UPI000F5AB3B5|nr:acyltransferase [Burkholderia sp. Bp9143]RQR26800.1 acyltransferase [Burkholderia sp. Bp9143]